MAASPSPSAAPAAPLLANLVLFPNFTQLDLTGPFEVLGRIPGLELALVGPSAAPVRSDRGLQIVPSVAREDARQADLLVVPGGPGTDDTLLDPAWVDFVRQQAAGARWVFGICTGSMLLGAAGVLRGRKAGSHWSARDLLAEFDATVSPARTTRDGNVFTAGGVTAGIDMALVVAAEIAGEQVAREIALTIEYDPAPPFPGGTPETAPPAVLAAVKAAGAQRRARREALAREAGAKLRR